MHCTHLNQVKEAFTEIQQVFIGLQKHSFSNYKSFYKHFPNSNFYEEIAVQLQLLQKEDIALYTSKPKHQ